MKFPDLRSAISFPDFLLPDCRSAITFPDFLLSDCRSAILYFQSFFAEICHIWTMRDKDYRLFLIILQKALHQC